jgi:hypothetical protein
MTENETSRTDFAGIAAALPAPSTAAGAAEGEDLP